MSEAVVETRGLRKRFGQKVAVEDLSLSVPKGEIFGFLGPNGAGKTTALKMLLGLVEPTAGSARVLGAPLGDRRRRSRIGFLPEHFRFQEWLTGRELLHIHGALYGMRRAEARSRADTLLARVDLLDAAERPIRTYSKGMMQRVGLAQALLNRPELVFLDEPTSGLDPLGRLLVRDIIRELRQQGTAVFLNSHLLGEVEATCDRVAFVKAGRIIHELALAGAERGFEVELRTGPLGDGALEALAKLGSVEPDPALPSGAQPSASELRLKIRVAADSALPEIARVLVQRGVALYEMKSARKSLEAWFLEVMGDVRPG
jgi:ABC-2 type transport system ATP-binding protein